MAELDELQKKIEETKKKSEKFLDTLKALTEAADVKLNEYKKESYEFKKEVVLSGEDNKSGKTKAEKIIRYMEEKLRQKDALIEKLRLKTVTLKAKCKKTENTLKQKEELGEVLHYIDFHQLKIENRQFAQKIEERNQELLQLKMTAGKTLQYLNHLKTQLLSIIKETEECDEDIKSRTQQLDHVRAESIKVKEEINKTAPINSKLKENIEETKNMPDVYNYVLQRAEEAELKKMINNWERKVEIAKMAAKRAETLARTAKMNSII